MKTLLTLHTILHEQEVEKVDNLMAEVFNLPSLDELDRTFLLLLPTYFKHGLLVDGKSTYDKVSRSWDRNLYISHKLDILKENEFLGTSLEYDITTPFRSVAILNPLAELMWLEEEQDLTKSYMHSKTTKYLDRILSKIWSCPGALLVLEGISKLATLCLVSYVSIHTYGELNLPNYTGTAQEYGLVVMLITSIIYEIGQFIDFVVHRKSFSRGLEGYVRQVWNRLDLIAMISIAVWAVSWAIWASGKKRHPDIQVQGRIFLAISAIPLSLSLLQYFVVIPELGHLVITIFEMLKDLRSFAFVCFVATLGFGLVLCALFYQNPTGEYRGLGHSFMELFAAMIGNIDYSSWRGDSTVTDVGIVIYLIFIARVGIVMMNLLIARMSNTHERILKKAKEEWCFSMVL